MRHLIYLLSIFFLLFTSGASAQIPHVSAGTIKHFEQFKSKYVRARNVDVWLPNNYSPGKKYAVLYMHDGMALFDSSIMWNKQTWGVDIVTQKLLDDHKIKDCIVVGIWNGDSLRGSEYFPQKAFEGLSKVEQDSAYNTKKGNRPFFATAVQSDNYLRFIVKELKPFIDSSFATYTDRKHTFIMGSSMGGLISMYAICEYPRVFGGAACLSTHWPGMLPATDFMPDALLGYMQQNLPSPKNHRIYFDYGSETLDSLYKPYQLRADKIMEHGGFVAGKNWETIEYPGANHSEKSWNKRLAVPVTFLLKN